MQIAASLLGNQGWPGWETTQRIAVDSTRVYEYSTWYRFPTEALVWLDIQLFDSTGQNKGGVSTGTTAAPSPNQWHKKTLTFNPSALASTFPDIAEVKLHLRLSLNYDFAGIPQGTTTTIYYDEVYFGVK